MAVRPCWLRRAWLRCLESHPCAAKSTAWCEGTQARRGATNKQTGHPSILFTPPPPSRCKYTNPPSNPSPALIVSAHGPVCPPARLPAYVPARVLPATPIDRRCIGPGRDQPTTHNRSVSGDRPPLRRTTRGRAVGSCCRMSGASRVTASGARTTPSPPAPPRGTGE